MFEGQATLEVSSDQTVATGALPITGGGTDELLPRFVADRTSPIQIREVDLP